MEEIKYALSKALSAFSDFIGKAAASYRRRWEADNERLRKIAQENQKQQILMNSRPLYELMAEMLMEAINNTVDVTGLHPVLTIRKLFTGPWLQKSANGLLGFCYHARYSRGYGVTAEDVRRILQNELNRLCDVYNIAPLAVRVVFGSDGTVRIGIADAAAVRATQKVIL